jgi:hypothetical protein
MWLRSTVFFRPCLFIVRRRSILDYATVTLVPSAPLLSNIMPHLQTLVNFVTNTLPKPVLVALVYRLTILLGAARVLPSIGVDPWEVDYGTDDGWDGRPVSVDPPDSTVPYIPLDIKTYTCPLDVSSIYSCYCLLTPTT